MSCGGCVKKFRFAQPSPTQNLGKASQVWSLLWLGTARACLRDMEWWGLCCSKVWDCLWGFSTQPSRHGHGHPPAAAPCYRTNLHSRHLTRGSQRWSQWEDLAHGRAGDTNKVGPMHIGLPSFRTGTGSCQAFLYSHSGSHSHWERTNQGWNYCFAGGDQAKCPIIPLYLRGEREAARHTPSWSHMGRIHIDIVLCWLVTTPLGSHAGELPRAHEDPFAPRSLP